MYILAGENQLTVAREPNVYRDRGVGLILTLEVIKETITFDALEVIINDIVDNAREIAVYNDNEEKIALLSGFHCEPSIIVKGGVYKVELIDASENTYQIGVQKLMIEQLNQLSANLTNTVNTQGEHMTGLEKTISEQSESILNQKEAIDAQAEAAAMQNATIDTILLELLPAIIETAVSDAVANALSNNSNTTDDSTEESIVEE